MSSAGKYVRHHLHRVRSGLGLSEGRQSAILGIMFVVVFLGLCFYFGKYAPQLAPGKPMQLGAAQVVPVAVKKVWLDDPAKLKRTDIITRQ